MFLIKPSRKIILTMFLVILVDVIQTVPFLSMSENTNHNISLNKADLFIRKAEVNRCTIA